MNFFDITERCAASSTVRTSEYKRYMVDKVKDFFFISVSLRQTNTQPEDTPQETA